MRLKYYMRGLGIGIVVTAVIMGVSSNGKKEGLTDAQIIARAKALGMVDGVLSELQEGESAESETMEETVGTEAADTEETAPEGTEAAADITDGNAATGESEAEAAGPEEAEIDMDLEHFEAGGIPEAQEEDGNSGNAEGSEAGGENETDVKLYTVAVYPGEGSYTVSRKLAALGLVESANLFDDFLCQNGYDKKLCTGNYRVKEGATAEEIAKVLTGQLSY